ncbi:MAG: NAD(P)/FAD-dependent oxidoreductase, partial [Deltaproteobacteria bacterium]|nr:NAD(P)/FAD-dependent oxidoreductase [Deltaproteobacteria bacterium]
MEKYDLCVIGGGPSGYAAAMRAVDFDKSVLLVERDRIGGAGIYDGALSSKTFWEISKEFASFSKKMIHYGFEEPVVHFHNVLNEVNDAVSERSNQLEEHLRLVIQKRPGGFRYIKGSAHLISSSEIELETNSGTEKVNAENIIIATGSRPRKIPSITIDEEIIMTSDGISSLEEFPESLVILGAGVIGCEFATIFSNFRKTKVHIISKEDRILPFEDPDLAKVIEANLEANGVLIHHESKLDKMEITNGGVEYVLKHPNGEKEVFQAEKALVSVGRVPNIENTGL